MTGDSKVGTSGVYEAGDQRNAKNEEHAERFHEGKDNSHQANDSKDQRSIANRLAAEEQRNKEEAESQAKKDPTLPAKMHGNEPSSGAKIDAQLQAEDEQRLREKAGK
ncbi:hypothetical protein CMUS01_03690 [Colletotrichum musicola]|uniref:Uncharacterized protein n=1 Tax=Colletotrichum musicola TaxID=2175873 RepID=A0A8H6U5L7_9PEZI|nr:hypothetical protein CMUS01_03690 [Colletotrichum musicola]